MRWRPHSLVVGLVVSLAVVSVAPAASAAPAKKTRKVDSRILASAVATTSAGGTVVAGTLRDPLLGDGAAVYRTTPAPNNTMTSTFTTFFDHGTIKGTALVRTTPQPDGSVRLEGTGKVTKGTGRYRGVKGTFAISDGVIASNGLITFTAKGTIRY